MRVYRMETPQGDGAFMAAPLGCDGLTDDYTARSHPTPWDDFRLQEHPNWDNLAEHPTTRFGCTDEDQLRHWFDDRWASLLSECGVNLTVWEVPDDAVAWSDKQAIFDVTRAACVERLPASALWQPEPQLTLPLAA